MMDRLKKVPFLEIILVLVLVYLGYIYVVQAVQVDALSPFTPFIDDSYIHLRFAHNFADGNGFVWNVGEPPVEGFTSFLWVVFLAILEYFGLSPILALPYIGVGCTIFTLLASIWLFEWINPGRWVENLLAVIMLALSPQLRFWSLSGLEVTFYVLFLVFAAASYVGYCLGKCRLWLVGVAFGVLSLVRPEAIGLFAVTLAFEAGMDLWERKLDLRKIGLLVASFAIVFLPVFLWKWYYFGYPFPNTYYAKTGAGWIQIRGGYYYVIDGIKQILKGSLIPVFLAVFSIPWRLAREKTYMPVLLAAIWGFTILTGGDYISWARFLVPGLPFLFALVAIGLSAFMTRLPILNKVALGFVVLGMTFLAWNPFKPFVDTTVVPMEMGEKADRTKLVFFNNWMAGFVIMGKSLDRIAEPTDTIAVIPVGAIGYYSNIKILDMTGLVDPVIAHEPFDLQYVSSWRPGHDKGDGAYILSKRPTYIQFVDLLSSLPYSELLPSSKQYKSIMEIWGRPEFLDLYKFYPVEVDQGWFYNLYRLKDNSPPP